MDPAIASLTKLAEDLTNRVDSLERENSELQAQLKHTKTASVAEVEKAPAVSEEIVDTTCSMLIKAGALKEDQVSLVKESFAKDPEAAHRAIQAILDAQIQTKNASAELALDGGKLVEGSTMLDTAADKFAAVERILGIRF